jgi:hypothetical protein
MHDKIWDGLQIKYLSILWILFKSSCRILWISVFGKIKINKWIAIKYFTIYTANRLKIHSL